MCVQAHKIATASEKESTDAVKMGPLQAMVTNLDSLGFHGTRPHSNHGP